MKMSRELIAKSYNGLSLVAIKLESDTFSFRRVFRRKGLKLSGHWCSFGVLESHFFALLVSEGRVLFLAESKIYDVTSEQWTAVTRRVGLFRYEFVLVNSGVQVYRFDYFELMQSSVRDMDPHFLVQAAGWLKDSDSRMHLVDFWEKN